jgi:uncharacterized membrane protein YhhN
MSFTWILIALVIALLDWVAVARQWKNLEYFAKPGVMLALLAWLWSVGATSGQMLWFAAGLVFSLAGDIFLMLPKEQFVAGLVAFLLAHVSYLMGFNATFPPINLVTFILVIMVALVAARLYQGISRGLVSSGNEKLKMPVLIYSIVISLMLLSALITLVRPEWSPLSAIMVSIGALLFFISDASLAWNKFVQPLRYGRLIVIVTYHLGQILIIVGAALQYMQP